jgi:hypothetical protein
MDCEQAEKERGIGRSGQPTRIIDQKRQRFEELLSARQKGATCRNLSANASV